MFAFCCLSLLALVEPNVAAASSPVRCESGGRAVEAADAWQKLETLNRQLWPLLRKAGLEDRERKLDIGLIVKGQCRIKVCRRIGPDAAKIGVVVHQTQFISGREKWGTMIDGTLTIYLHFYDGAWTTSRYEVSGDLKEPLRYDTDRLHELMLAIDEAAGRMAKSK